jgi:polysaccharide biosynthesis/export protein
MERRLLAVLVVGALAVATGCHAVDFYTPSLQTPVPAELEPPRELSMVTLPAYRIAPPDVLQLEVVKLVPRGSCHIGPLDTLTIRVLGTLKASPINKAYRVDADGTIALGPPYGVFRVEGLTIEEAEKELTRSLKMILNAPIVTIQVTQFASYDRLSGTYPVQSDGTINLHNFGMVYVTGMTVTEAMEAVQTHLAQYFDSIRVGVEVLKFNSKGYCVITESQQDPGTMQRFPITGNETVLDAIANMEKKSRMSSKMIWVARPAPGNCGQEQILPVNWDAITHGGITDTNYQIFPGDRIYIVDDKAVGVNAFISKFANPIERLLGIGYQGTSEARDAETLGREYNARGVRGGY